MSSIQPSFQPAGVTLYYAAINESHNVLGVTLPGPFFSSVLVGVQGLVCNSAVDGHVRDLNLKLFLCVTHVNEFRSSL